MLKQNINFTVNGLIHHFLTLVSSMIISLPQVRTHEKIKINIFVVLTFKVKIIKKKHFSQRLIVILIKLLAKVQQNSIFVY